jgi:hypothetical protein
MRYPLLHLIRAGAVEVDRTTCPLRRGEIDVGLIQPNSTMGARLENPLLPAVVMGFSDVQLRAHR